MARADAENESKRIALFSVVALLLDGFDQQLLPLAAPVILREWGIPHSQMGVALAATLIGMTLGTIGGGYAGDRFGRHVVVIASTAVFAMATLLISLSSGPMQLAALRLAGGLAFGAVVPNAIAMASNSVTSSTRVKIVALLTVCVPVGATIGALAVGGILSVAGWRTAFVVGGVSPLLLSLLMLLFMPHEAPGRSSPEVRPRNVQTGASRDSRTISRRRLLTVGLWLAFFANGYAVYAVANWMAVMLSEAGFSAVAASQALFCFAMANILGSLGGGVLAGRMGDARAGMTTAVAVVATIALVAFVLIYGTVSFPIVAGSLLASGLAMGALQTVCYVIASSSYPSERSASGIGLAVGINRLGGILAVGSGGILLDRAHGNPAALMLSVCLVATLTIPGMLLIREQRQRDRSLVGTEKAIGGNS